MLSEATVQSQAETDVSLDATRWAWVKSAHKGNTLLVLLALADHADREGAAWPSVGTLATETRMEPRTVQNHLRTLRDAGEIIVAQWGGRGDGDSTRYLLHRLDRDGIEIQDAR